MVDLKEDSTKQAPAPDFNAEGVLIGQNEFQGETKDIYFGKEDRGYLTWGS